MRLAVLLLALIWLVAVLGCQKKSAPEAQMPLHSGVTDISIPAAPVPYTPAPAPQPVVYDSTPAPAVATPASGGDKYVVQKGDTLFSLAKNRYGNGNQYPKILSANPGLTPENLQAGQTITIP
jgi:5'-nucleotidase / UDP-sugar diphosphatase